MSNVNNSQTPNTAQYANTNFIVKYPNGSKIQYSGGSGSGNNRRHYPYIIQDSNGNRIQIFYKNNQSGRIDYIVDTLNRQIKFYYDTDTNGNADKLIAVTIPGMNAGEELQTARFYYQDDFPLNYQTGFSGQVTAPSTIRILKYVYFPATKTGFKYDYHSTYGMIKKITRQVGMQVSTTATTTIGTLIEGIEAASTEYDYPDGATALADVPKYTKRTDDWAGRTSAAAETFYDAPDPAIGATERVSKIIVKDGSFDIVNETVSHNTAGWQNGLIKETLVKKIFGLAGQNTTVMAKTKYFWVQGAYAYGGRQNPKLQKVEVTNEAGQTKATEFEYDGYNNQTKIREYDFAAAGSTGILLRTTDITYETGAGWINANLLGLTKSIKTTVGGAVVSKTLYEYDYNGSEVNFITRRDDINPATHDTFFNPAYPERTVTICPVGDAPNADGDGCVREHRPGYNGNSAYRGNVTKVGRMIDVNAAVISETNSDKSDYNYDIAGNLVSATLSCCQLKIIAYEKATEYAFPVSETKGTSPQLINSVIYNRNTGLVTSSTDENNQITYYEYEPDTLRHKKTIYPNGGYSESEYSDQLITDPIGFVRQTTTLEANKTVQSYSYFDGRGASIRSATETPDGWSIAAVEYDALGRARKSYNPFYAAAPNAVIPAATKFTEVTNYDALGRTTEVKLQDTTTAQTVFNGTTLTVTDQAGKQRRQVADALGRIVRVDEPDINGNLGDATPTQPTVYEYDGNDNLIKVTQADGATVQERRFKYDALSRMTHERQVEANATLDENGVKVTSGGLWTKHLKYSAKSLLTEGTDARGVKTTFGYDGLNRVAAVTFSDGTPSVTYTYDQARSGFFNKGALTRVETAIGGTVRPDTPATATEFDYDKMGRAVKHRQSIGAQIYNLDYGYNLAGQLISETYPSGKVVSMDYDTGGRLSSIADQSRTYLSSLQYQGKGNSLSSMTSGNGTTQTFGLNDRLQMTNQTLSKGAEVLQKYDYGYGQIDQSGNLDTTKNNGQLAKIESFIGTQKQFTQKFTYDSLGRLSEAKEERGDTNALSYRQKFDFDKFGNLYRKAQSNSTAGQATPLPYTPIEDSDISKATNRFTANTTYDEAGNVISDAKFRQMSFGYDANGRMITAVKANAPDAASVYDASGQRVAEKVQDVWKFSIYDAFGKMVAEYGGLSSTDDGGVKYVLQDWQGSSRAIVSNAGFVNARMDYTAFGEEIYANVGMRTTAQGFNATNNLAQKYAQTERDKATGLDHTWFRKLENQAGRWTSPDPYNGSMSLGNPQSFNRYSYVENEPTNYIDPSGLNLTYFTVRVCDVGIEWMPTNCRDVVIHVMNTGGSSSGGTETGGGSSGDVLDYANNYYVKYYDECNGASYGIGKEQTALALTAAAYRATRATQIAAIWAKESSLEIRPRGDAGPAQLTTWWSRNQPQLIVGNAYGSWNGNKGQPFDGDPLANLTTLSNIVGFSLDRYNGSFEKTAYWYGPGSKESPRDKYAKDVVGNFNALKPFFDCIVNKGQP